RCPSRRRGVDPLRHVPRIARPIVLALPVLLAWTAVAGAQPTPTPNPIAVCAEKFTKEGNGLGDYIDNGMRRITGCALDLVLGKSASCTPSIKDIGDDLIKKVGQCDLGALDALCPLGADTYAEANDVLIGNAPTSIKNQ